MKTRIRHWATGSTAIGLCLVLSGCAAFPKLRTGTTPALSVQDVTAADMVEAASERPTVNEATLIDIPKSSDSGIKPSEPEARQSRRRPFLGYKAGRVTCLRWVPKVAIHCTQGTSVPEAVEVNAELDFKFGPHNVIRLQDCERLNE